MPEPSPSPTQPVRVWDLPIRVFHWLLAICVVGLLITGKVGGNALTWHMRFGLVVMGLLVFRLAWGFVGGHWARFASFVHGPATLMRYLRGRTRDDERLDVGHNPLGALSVLAMLGFLAAQVGTGLVADDEIATTGPLNKFVASASGLAATRWHKDFGEVVLIVLVVLHVAAILFYKFKKGRELVPPMIHGDKLLPAGTPASRDNRASRLLALVLAVACLGLMGWVHKLGG